MGVFNLLNGPAPTPRVADTIRKHTTSTSKVSRRKGRKPTTHINVPGQSKKLETPGASCKRSLYTKVEVLILKFASDDLGLETELKQVREAFESLNYKVRVVDIKMKDAWRHLEVDLNRFLQVSENEETLHIVYYAGHGDKDEGSTSLRLWSGHKGIAIDWKSISQLIAKSTSDTLVFLDCCHAGLAAHSIDEAECSYRKMLVTSCSWESKCRNHFYLPLCEILLNMAYTGLSISADTLLEGISRRLLECSGEESRPSQPNIHRLIKTNRPMIDLGIFNPTPRYNLRQTRTRIEKNTQERCQKQVQKLPGAIVEELCKQLQQPKLSKGFCNPLPSG